MQRPRSRPDRAQFPAYTTVPILFLSTESRLDLTPPRHLGGDDFLSKPFAGGSADFSGDQPRQRYRALKKLTNRDSLDRPAQPPRYLRYLEREISVADRAGRRVLRHDRHRPFQEGQRYLGTRSGTR